MPPCLCGLPVLRLAPRRARVCSQSLKFPPSDLIPRFELIVYEAGNFADGKRTLAEIEDAVTTEYGELPEGLIEGVFDRLVKIGLVEWVEQKK